MSLLEYIWKCGVTRQATNESAIFGQVIKQNQKYMSFYFK